MTQPTTIPLRWIPNHPLATLSTYKIGGPARFFAEVDSIQGMRWAIEDARSRQLPLVVIGKGSNTLFADSGFNGCVVLNKIDFLESSDGGEFYVGGGYSFSRLGTLTAREGWTGLEFASGIPGTVGGAVVMNAGANGRETCESLVSVEWLDDDGALMTTPRVEIEFGYRSSPFQKRGVVVAARFQLEPDTTARTRQLELFDYRKQTQPYGESSAGCVFRNPDGAHAGKLIDQCELKGVSVGDAEVSGMHANFIINKGDATAADIEALIDKVRRRVKDATGYELVDEVQRIPFDMRYE